MFTHITEKTFYQYLKCPNWVYFDIHALERQVHHPLLQRLMMDGLIEEKQRELISDREDLVEVTAEDPDEAFRQTLAFMQEGRQSIFHGVLIDKHWVGHPDILEKVEGRSAFGNYYYVAVDLKRSRFLRDDFQFQGCFYAELLQRIQKVKPQQGYILTPDKEAISYQIEAFEGAYALTLDEIEKIIAGKRPAHFLTSGCKQSPWFAHCKEESESCEDLSLLNRVWRKEVAVLQQAGVQTISQLALKSVVALEKLAPEVNTSRLEIMRDQAVAIVEHRHIIRHTIELPLAKYELFFDIESDPLRDFDYLFGVLVVEQGKETYQPLFAQSSNQEETMWKEFVSLVEQHLGGAAV